MSYKNPEKAKAACRAYHDANREAILERKRKYRETHKEEIRQYSAEYIETHKDILAERNRRNHIKFQETILAKKKVYRNKPKGRFMLARSKAKGRGYDWRLTFEEWQDLIKGGTCHYCNRPLSIGGSGLDRKNNDPFYTVDSAVPCCKRCNTVFMDLFSYEEKLLLAATIREIEKRRSALDKGYEALAENKPLV